MYDAYGRVGGYGSAAESAPVGTVCDYVILIAVDVGRYFYVAVDGVDFRYLGIFAYVIVINVLILRQGDSRHA